VAWLEVVRRDENDVVYLPSSISVKTLTVKKATVDFCDSPSVRELVVDTGGRWTGRARDLDVVKFLCVGDEPQYLWTRRTP
jgi:hypothetical protein